MPNFQIELAQMHFSGMQMNNTQPTDAVSTHNYAPKVSRVIETRGTWTAVSKSWTGVKLTALKKKKKKKSLRILRVQY
jgi:hypothetical protein